MRFAIRLFVVSTAAALIACSGGGDDTAAPIPPAQRFLTAEEAPGSKPDPVETRETVSDFDGFIAALSERSIDPDEDEMTEIFQEAGFESAGIDTRFYGETHTPGRSTHVVSSFIELGSEEGATSALDWLEADVRKPCPLSCAVEISTFEVDEIADGRGVHAIATAEDIEDRGTADEVPFESYWVGFTDGAFAYSVDLFGRPGSVSEEQALEIANAYYERLTGA